MEDLLGWESTGAIHPEDVDAMVDRWRLSLARGELFLHEARLRGAGTLFEELGNGYVESVRELH
jgi:hypothetical protein